jgi:hypothetical protein
MSVPSIKTENLLYEPEKKSKLTNITNQLRGAILIFRFCWNSTNIEILLEQYKS